MKKRRTIHLSLSLALAIVLALLAGSAPGVGRAEAPGVAFPLQPAADGRRLEDQNGVPFLLLGDTAWAATVRLTLPAIESYLDDRQQRGFNTILVQALEHRFNGSCTVDVDCWTNPNGDDPFTTMNPDVAFDSPNLAYWDQLDLLLDAARDRDMLVLFTPAYIGVYCNADGWGRKMGEEADDAEMRAYGEFLGARYADQGNLVWVLGGDSHPDDTGCPAGLIDRIAALEEGIAVHDPVQLRTALDRRGYSARDRYGSEAWLDLGSTFSGCQYAPGEEPFFDAYASALRIKDDYDASSSPFIFLEGRYEGEGASLQCVLSQAWWSMLGGAAGHVFGNNPLWFFGSGWPASLGSSGSIGVGKVAELLAPRRWFELVPDYAEEIVTAGRGQLWNSNYVGAASTPDGSLLLVWIPEAVDVTVDLSRLAGLDVDVWRVDPTDGSAVFDGSYATDGPRVFSSPGLELLIFENVVPVPALGVPGAVLLAVLLAGGAFLSGRLGRLR